MLLVMGLACFLAWQVKHDDNPDGERNDQRNSSVNSNSAPSSSAMQQLANQQTTISQQQQQQQQQQGQAPQLPPLPQGTQLQSPSNPITANGTAHHYQLPSLQAHFHGGPLINNNCLPPNQPITMAVKQQNGFAPAINPNLYYKNPNQMHQQMPGVYVQLGPAVPPRYSQANSYS